MINPNTYYNNFLQEFTGSISTLAYPNYSKSLKIKKLSSIMDMKFFPAHFGQYGQSGTFLSRAISAISNTKKQIMILLNSQFHTQFLSSTSNVYETLRELNGDPIQILQTKTVKCYQNILLIQHQNQQIKNNKIFKTMKKILQQLVRFSIIFKQYQKRKNLVKSQTQIQIESDCSSSSDLEVQDEIQLALQHPIKKVKQEEFQIDQKLIKSIQVQVFKKQFYDLVIQYLNGQRIKLEEIKQICRICQMKVRVEEMSLHLQSCERRHYTLQSLQMNKNNLLKLHKQIKLIQSNQNEVYPLLCQEIDKISKHSNESYLDVFSVMIQIQQKIEQLQEKNQNSQILISFKKLINQRHQLIMKLKEKESLMKQQLSGVLAVDSTIKQNNKQTQISLESIKQQSWIRENSTISIESKIQIKKEKDDHNPSERKILSHQETNRPIGKLNIKSKKSIHWQQKAINTKKSLKNFELLKFLGKGAFGKVYLVRDNLTHDQYAVKCIKMDNKLLQDEKNIQNLKNQHDIFRKISGQFLVKAAFSFSEGSMHMFFLEYMPGGDFAALLQQQVYLQQDIAKFYLAEIVLAIEHLHNMNIIHRDLKPANLVFDQNGHLKLTDFGLSKEGITKKLLITKQQSSSEVNEEKDSNPMIKKESSSKSNFCKRQTLVRRPDKDSSNKSIVGTPDYIAPEVLNGISTQNSSIDWWSFGVIVYQTLIGVRPFGAMTIDKIYKNIRSMKIEWPQVGQDDGCISQQAKDLIESLLNINYTQRLGAQTINQIKNHPFFSGICWQKLKSQTPPLPPKMKSSINLRQDLVLRQQIEQQMNDIPSTLDVKIKLDDYMRIDLLSQTTAKAFKQVKLKKSKMSCLYRQCVQKVQSMKDMPI